MILIESVKHYEVEGDIGEVMEYPPMEAVCVGAGAGAIQAETFQKEIVQGRRFRRPSDGMDIVVGMSSKVQDILGIQFEGWGWMEKEILTLSKKLQMAIDCDVRQTEILLKHTNASFKQRLKWLFTGIK